MFVHFVSTHWNIWPSTPPELFRRRQFVTVFATSQTQRRQWPESDSLLS
jgi:hypothetical protein